MSEAQMPFGGYGSAQPDTGDRDGYGRTQYGLAQGYQARAYQHPHDDQIAAQGGDPASGSVLSVMGQVTGALVSLGLVVGVSVWGYQSIMRDVSGVPVVRAAEGPMRVAPETPGGAQAPHQGLSVNEVAGGAAAGGPVDAVRLAPPPVGLSEEDQPAGVTPWTTEEAAAGPQPTTPVIVAPQEPSVQDAAIQALADQIAAQVAPLTALAPADATSPPPEVETRLSEAPVVTGARSLRPQARPTTLVAASLPVSDRPAPQAEPGRAVVDLDPATLPVGTRLVQLGAYDSIETAQQEWARIAARFDSFFVDKRRVIEGAESGGRSFFRLRAEGFADLGAARRFCAALVAERTDCIPVVTR